MTEVIGRSIFARINAVMRRVQHADKTRVNAHMKYKFIGHEDVTAALREAMVEEGIVQTVSVDQCIREGSAVRVNVRITWICDAGAVSITAWGESFSVNKSGTPDDVQIGKAVSYAVKTAQLKNFMLLGDTTPDSEESHGREERKPVPLDSDAEQRAVELIKELDDCPADHEVFAAIVKSIEAIHTKVSKATIARLNTAYMQAEKRIEDGIRN